MEIPWITGKGNIVVGLAGSGDGQASFSSDTENDDVDRSQEVTIKTTRAVTWRSYVLYVRRA